jgi:hypothetical protein
MKSKCVHGFDRLICGYCRDAAGHGRVYRRQRLGVGAMNDRQLRELERIGVALAKSAARVRFYRTRPDLQSIMDWEEGLLARRVAEVAEVVANGGDWRWVGGSTRA